MTDKSNVPLLTAEDMLDLSPFGQGLIKAKINAIADGRAIVISAADLKAKDAEVERRKGEFETLHASHKWLYAERRRLQEEKESLRLDAERYRFIKENPPGRLVAGLAISDAANWDRTIDAALARYDARKGASNA